MLCRTKILSLALRLLYLSAWCLVATLPSARTQGVVSSDLSKLRSVGGVALSPDGRHLAYSVVMRDEPGRPYGQLWMMELTTQKSIRDRKSTRLNSSHPSISYAVFCLKKKK